MNKANHLYEPHLVVCEVSVLPGGEWAPRSYGWSLIQVESGTGYWLQAQSNTALETGAVLVVAGEAQGRIRASQLNGMSLCAFNVVPSRLSGLITLGEQDFFKQAAGRTESAFQILPPENPIAAKMKESGAGRNGEGLLLRLTLLQLFVEAFGKELAQPVPGKESADARERLRDFLQKTPPDALLEISFSELAQMTHCTPRHLSRIFYELVGMSFRDKRAEIRLSHARKLLATSQCKVVEVALESGYKSLSLFNLMFARRFGISPGRWRQKHGLNGGTEPLRTKSRRFAVG